MRTNIAATPDGIVYRERLSAVLRLFIAVIGAGCGIMIPAVWISLADWTTLSIGAVVAVIVSLVTGLLGLLIVTIAFLPAQTLVFLSARPAVIRETRGPLGKSRSEIEFSRLRGIELDMRDSEDGAYPVLELSVWGLAQPLVLVDIGDRQEALEWRDRIARRIE